MEPGRTRPGVAQGCGRGKKSKPHLRKTCLCLAAAAAGAPGVGSGGARSVLLVEDEALLFIALRCLHLEEAAEASEEEGKPHDADQHGSEDGRGDSEYVRAFHQRSLLQPHGRPLRRYHYGKKREGQEQLAETCDASHLVWRGA